MRHVKVRSLVCQVAAALLATGVATASAQGPRETQVRTLGGATRFSQPMHTVSDLHAMVNTNRNQIGTVLTLAGIGHLSTQVIDTLTTGSVSDVTVAPDTHLEWMALKRSGTPALLRNVRWVGRQSFDAYQFTVEAAGYTYTFVVPKVCGNLSLVSRNATPVAAIPQPAPEPPPPPPPAPAPAATAGIAPPPPVAPAPPGEYFGWVATGFIGSYFGAGGQSTQANDINGSLTYGGQIGKMYGHWGAEVVADFAPKYKIDSLALSEHPEVNAYMANVVGIWNTRFQTHVQPYFSAGIGTIQMHTSILPATALTGSLDNTKVWENRFGWDVGGGFFAFAGRSVGFRADARYFSANNSSDNVNDAPAQRVSSALLSGLSFWRANIGVAFRW
jgi:hypothetical protein